MSKKFLSTNDITYMSLCTALIVVCSWISLPFAVPFTLQTFAVAVTGGLLGAKKGTMTVIVYILLGIVGLPVFASFKSGAAVVLGATGGYLLGFIFFAFITGLAADRFGRKTYVLLSAALVSLAVCYAFGTLWFVLVYSAHAKAIGVVSVLSSCVFPFIIPDLVKLALAVLCIKKLNKFVK